MSYDIDAVRAQFPALAIEDDGLRRIYLDNPAGTQVPASVAQAMSGCLLETNANGGGYFRTSHQSDAVVASARAAMAGWMRFVRVRSNKACRLPLQWAYQMPMAWTVWSTEQPCMRHAVPVAPNPPITEVGKNP